MLSCFLKSFLFSFSVTVIFIEFASQNTVDFSTPGISLRTADGNGPGTPAFLKSWSGKCIFVTTL